MPLTVYSISEAKELDVEQVLSVLSKKLGVQPVSINDPIPELFQQFFRTDLECPCCFTTGAELVKPAVSKTSMKALRQACFRFVVPGHHPHCDYVASDSQIVKPENLIDFGNAKNAVTRAVRELVCSGIQNDEFSQKTIRNMREWFFQQKLRATFIVTLDHRIPNWLNSLWRMACSSTGQLPQEIPLTQDIATINGFDWSKESVRVLTERHGAILNTIRTQRLWLHQLADRVEQLAKRNYGVNVFDPTMLQPMYQLSLVLSDFMINNYASFKKLSGNKSGQIEPCVLAFSALLLYVNEWKLGPATSMFARISALVSHADPALGNVIGLNPFHDFEAWHTLKRLQDLQLNMPERFDIHQEKKEIEEELRARFHV